MSSQKLRETFRQIKEEQRRKGVVFAQQPVEGKFPLTTESRFRGPVVKSPLALTQPKGGSAESDPIFSADLFSKTR